MTRYLTEAEMASIVEAIQSAESHSTGEIRVHIDNSTAEKEEAREANAKVAFEVFKTLCMEKTRERNAVLFHINFEQRYFTVIGDEGIHAKVRQNFWDTLHEEVTAEFSKSNYCQGLRHAILKTGLELKKHFPLSGENINELPNEITFS